MRERNSDVYNGIGIFYSYSGIGILYLQYLQYSIQCADSVKAKHRKLFDVSGMALSYLVGSLVFHDSLKSSVPGSSSGSWYEF